jgi:CspA family cold shock protein
MTTFKDIWATNEQGEKFLFTVEMQRRLSEQGLPVEPAYVSEIQESSYSQPQDRKEPSYKKEYEERERRPEPRQESRESFTAPETIQIDPQTGKYVGRMKWYNARKGYGFIVRGGGEEIFFHKSNTVGDPEELNEGQWILYDIEETHKGLEATDIEPYDGDTELLT